MSSVDYGFKKPSDFVGALVEWVNRNGGGIVPLTGAGISVTAGIPVLLLLEPYLRDCVIRSVLRLCTKGPKPLSVPAAFAWNPHDDPWPKLRITPQEAAERDRRMSLFTKHFFTEHYQAASNLGGDSGIVREAAGALADWRACLFFLSRLERGPKPSLGAGKTWIVDAFVRHFTANASPSLEHRMFAMLGDLLRIRISITTNFDNLTERASAEIGRLLEVYDVHQQAGMPPADTVHQAGPALIKVHGGRYGYRADYSLVEAPTADERRAFASYIAGRPIDPELWERLTAPAVADNELLRTFATDTSIPRALLVCGVGSKDKRILQLIESAVLAMRIRPKRSDEESGSPPFRVFWVAYSWADVKVVKDLAKDHPTLHGMITFTQERYLGLMLLELYQRLTGNVPPTAVEFPAMWRISTPPSPANPDPHWMETGEFEKPDDRNPAKKQPISASNCVLEATSQLFKAFEAMKGDRNPTERRLIRIVPEADESDAVTVAAYGFHKQLEDRNACIWIELDQVANPDELFERILQAMGKLIGDDRHLTSRATDHPKVNGEPIAPPDVDAREKDRLREFHHMANGAISRWRIFLYCTEGFGTSIDFNPFEKNASGFAPWPARASSWEYLDVGGVPSLPDGFFEVLKTLTEPILIDGSVAAGATVVLIIDEKHDSALASAIGNAPSWAPHQVPVAFAKSSLSKKSFAAEVANLRGGDPARRFAYLQTLSELPRYPAGLVLWPARGGEDMSRFEIAGSTSDDKSYEAIRHGVECAKEMGGKLWVRTKSGGFIWMSNADKDALRSELHKAVVQQSRLQKYSGGDDEFFAISAHQALADWYWKLFLSCGLPSALFESIRHRLGCVRASLDTPKDRTDPRKRAYSSLIEAATALCLGRDTLLSRGYTAGSCDRLERIWKAVDGLKTWYEPQRENFAPAFEIALDKVAYYLRYNLFRLAIEVVNANKISRRLADYMKVIESPAQLQTGEHQARKAGRKGGEESIKSLLEAVLAAIHSRQFVLAAAIMHQAIHDLEVLAKPMKVKLPLIHSRDELDQTDVKKARDDGGECGLKLFQIPNAVKLAIRVYRRSMFLDLQRGEVEHVAYHYTSQDAPYSERAGTTLSADRDHLTKAIKGKLKKEGAEKLAAKSEPRDLAFRMRRAALTYHFAAELTRFLMPDDRYRLHTERISLKQTYGTVLSICGEYTEANQRFSEAQAISAYMGGAAQEKHDPATGVWQAESVLRRAYQHRQNDGFSKRFNDLRDVWIMRRSTCDPDRPIVRDERDRVLAWIWDAHAMLDKARERNFGRRKDAWWGARYLYTRLRAEAFRCVTLAGSSQHERLMEARGAGRPSSLTVIADLLDQMIRIMRTDTFIVARGVHQAFLAIVALRSWHTPEAFQSPKKSPMPPALRDRMNHELKSLDEALARVTEHLDKARKGYDDHIPDPSALRYVDWTIHRIKTPLGK